MQLNEIFGNNVKYFRYLKKYTQEKVSELTDISVTYISQLELGHHSPSFEILQALADALEVEPFEFYVKRSFKSLPPRVDMNE
ncbi:MAG: helix-turn-helix transcriptional regulator [Bacilli bacterium]|nr:helix-turn-helix transcriptional regulator [Bacilli bacterium]